MLRLATGWRDVGIANELEKPVPQYRKAPITEAVIELQVRLATDVTAEMLREVNRDLLDLGEVKQLKMAHFELRVGDDQPSSSDLSEKAAGWAFISPDKRRVMQARIDAFAFSHLAPYSSWDELKTDFQRAWAEYVKVAQVQTVTQVRLRYINQFNLPLPIRDFKDYFLTVPEIAPALPQALAGYFLQAQIPVQDLESMLVLTQTMVPPPEVGIGSIVLDLDLRRNGSPSLSSNNFEGVWNLLEEFHALKNTYFEGCITDATRELIR
jgi:uncharacterized protein (TIGR04255 family)